MTGFKLWIYRGVAILCGIGSISAQNRPGLDDPDNRFGRLRAARSARRKVSRHRRAEGGRPLTQQASFDTSGDGTLTGAYFVRQVLTLPDENTSAITRAVSLIGTMIFDGKGNFTFSGQELDSTKGSTASSYSISGTYGVSSSGLVWLQNPIDSTDTEFGGVGATGEIVASATEGNYDDIFVAIPAGPSSVLQGSYQMGFIDFLQGSASNVRDGYFTLTANGNGSFGNVLVNGYMANQGSANVTQTLSGVSYSFSGTNGTLAFPTAVNPLSALVNGQKTFSVSADGNILVGGNPNGFDLIVGMKSAASVSNSTFSGVYFIGALENDVSGSCGEPDCIDSFYGSLASDGQGAGTEHLRDTGFNYPVYDYTSDVTYNLPENAFLVGTNREGLLEVGTGDYYTLVVLFQAKTYSGTGVFVNPDGIVNAASFAPITNSVAPGEYETLFGSGLGANALAPSLPLPATLGTAQATVSGTTAPLLAVSPTLMSIFVPNETPNSSFATFQTSANRQLSNQVTLYTAPTAPGVFTSTANGIGPADVFHANYTPVTQNNPAAPGESLFFYATGLGATTPAVADGTAAPVSPAATVNDPGLSVDIYDSSGIVNTATIAFAGLAGGLAGIYQVNFTVPAGVAPGEGYLDLGTTDGYTSEAKIYIQAAAPVSITVSPSTASVATGGTRQFTATVTGAANTAVTWSVNGITGGNSSIGMISTTGLYTAPASVPSPNTVTVKATSVQNPSISGSAAVTITGTSITTLTITTSGTGSGTVSSSPAGTSCGSGCLTFPTGIVVTLTATPATGSTFAGWSGACTGTASCTVTMNSNQSVTGTFNLTTTGIVPQLAGAFNFPGPDPVPGLVTYTDKSGQLLTSDAYPGQIFLLVAPSQMDAASVATLAAAHSGSVIAQIPNSGLYWIQVRVGAEAPFIAAVQTNPAAIFVGPDVPATGAQQVNPVNLGDETTFPPLTLGGPLGQLDVFGGDLICGAVHGVDVYDFLSLSGLAPEPPYDASYIQQGTNQVALDQHLYPLARGSDIGAAMAQMAQGNYAAGRKLVLNLSLQAAGQPNDGVDRSICETNPNNAICSNGNGANYASWKADEYSFLVGIAGALEFMPQNLLDNTMVVVAAGNSGLDLTNEIGLIQTLLPNAFAHMLIVGSEGADASGQPNRQPFFGHNHSTDPTAMVYAPGVMVAPPGGTPGCTASGTSFAAPLVAGLAAQFALRSPNLTTAQIVQAIESAAPVVNGYRMIPSLAQVIQIPVTLTVAPPALSFSATLGGANPASQGVTVSSSASVSVSAHTNASWLNLAFAGAVLTVSVNIAGLPSSAYSSAITIYGTGVAPATVPVSLTISPPQQGGAFDLTTITAGTGSGTISVSSSSSSLYCGANCLSFAAGAVVTLTATPKAGSTFAGWSGACSGTGICTVTMNSNQSVTATFNPTVTPTYTLTVVMAGLGSGTVTSLPLGISCVQPASSVVPPCTATFAAGTQVILTAITGTGATFVGWSGPSAPNGTGPFGCSTSGTCTIVMNQDQTLIATFSTSSSSGSLTGTWSGTWTWTGTGSNGCTFNDAGAFSMTLTQSGNTYSSSNVSAGGVQTRDASSNCDVVSSDTVTGGTATLTSSGTAFNLSFSLSGSSFTGTAILNNNTLTATFQRTLNGTGPGSFNLVRQ